MLGQVIEEPGLLFYVFLFENIDYDCSSPVNLRNLIKIKFEYSHFDKRTLRRVSINGLYAEIIILLRSFPNKSDFKVYFIQPKRNT